MRRGGLRPALYAYGRAHRARDPCARRPSPPPPTRGGGTADAAPGPCRPRAMRGLPPRLPRLLRRMGGIPPPGPHMGARSAGRAHSARILPPPMRLGLLCVPGVSPISPPAPSPAGPRGSARSRPPAGGDGGCSHRPASFYMPDPFRIGCRTRSAYKGKWVSARRHAHPLDKPLGIW